MYIYKKKGHNLMKTEHDINNALMENQQLELINNLLHVLINLENDRTSIDADDDTEFKTSKRSASKNMAKMSYSSLLGKLSSSGK